MSMAALDASSAPSKRYTRPGFWVTTGWFGLVFGISQLIGLATAGGFLLAGKLGSLNLFENGPLLAVSTVAAFIPQLWCLLAIAARYSGGALMVLGLVKPTHSLVVACCLAAMVGFLLTSDVIVHFSGRPLVSEFQIETYGSVMRAGWLYVAMYWLGTCLCAPVVEELMFRGLAFAGYRPVIGTVPTVLLVTFVWTGLHLQYDFAEMVEVFAAGIVFSAARILGGTLWLPIAMHVLMNVWGTFETAVEVKWPFGS